MDNLTSETSTKVFEWDIQAIPDTQIVKLERSYKTDYLDGQPISTINTQNYASLSYGSLQLNLYFKDSADLDNVILALTEIKTEYFNTPPKEQPILVEQRTTEPIEKNSINLKDNVQEEYLDFADI